MNQVTSNHLVEKGPSLVRRLALPPSGRGAALAQGEERRRGNAGDQPRYRPLGAAEGLAGVRRAVREAAAREAGEEAGLKGAISSQEAGRYYYSKGLADGGNVRCEVLVYPLEVDDVADKWKEKGERKRKWVSPAKAAAMVAEADLGKVILAFAGKPRRIAA